MRVAADARRALQAPAGPQPANDPYVEVIVGGLRTACLTRGALARMMVQDCLAARQDRHRHPRLVFASNGHAIALAARDKAFRSVFEQADIIHADGQAARVWVNAADDPEACAFTLPAVLRRGPVSVAVSTGGHSPALAGWLRDQIAAQLGPEIGALAELLS